MKVDRHAHVVTERLDLRIPDSSFDLRAMFAIFSDPRAWCHAPAGRHAVPEMTRAWLERAAARFAADCLSYWTVRLRDVERIIGVAGAQRQPTGAWNIMYRLATAQRGHGYAIEAAAAGLKAAGELDARVPRVAWILPHHVLSQRVADRLGLTNYGLMVDPSDGQERLAYSDRPLSARYAGRAPRGSDDSH